jgi:hypothetical protein
MGVAVDLGEGLAKKGEVVGATRASRRGCTAGECLARACIATAGVRVGGGGFTTEVSRRGDAAAVRSVAAE